MEEDAETLVHHSRKRLRRLGSLKGVDGSASAGKDAKDPMPSPQLSPRSESGDLTPPAGDDGDSLSAPSREGGGEVTQGEPLLEEHVCLAAQAEDVVMESSTAETAQKAAESTPAEDEASDPATAAAEEIETPARQTSQVSSLTLLFFNTLVASTGFFICFETSIPSFVHWPLPSAAPQAEEPDLLEVVADIGRSAADEAAKVAATEGQDLTAGGTQGPLAVMEHSLESAPVEEVVIEAKIPLQTMGPLPSFECVVDAPPSSSSTLAVVPLLPDIGAPGPTLTHAELDEELQRLLAPLHLGGGEANNSAAITMDFSFIESMVAGVKEMQARLSVSKPADLG